MIELHPETYNLLLNFLTSIQSTLTKTLGADQGDEALEAALGKFCLDHLDCDIDENGHAVLRVAQEDA